MTTRDTYAHGEFSWIDLSAADMEAAGSWYADIFGWEYKPGDDPNMPYGMWFKDGKTVGGVGELNADMKAAGVPPMWNSYLNVDDGKAMEAKVTAAGGKVTVPFMPVGPAGGLAFFLDPNGASFGVWQPGEHKGAQLRQEAGSLCWNEMVTRNVDGAKAFYSKVFGWDLDGMPMPDGSTYTLGKVGELMAAGIMNMPEGMDGLPDHWSVYIEVENTADTAQRVQDAGGKLHFGPLDIQQGTIATLSDPQGAVFCVIQSKQPG